MPHKIIDTNVPLTATGANEVASEACWQECVSFIGRVLEGEIVPVIDPEDDVYREYRRNMHPDPNPGAGLADQFLMYLITNRGNEEHVRVLDLAKDDEGRYEDYPDNEGNWTSEDRRCKQFDEDDKKWVALAVRFKKDSQADAPIVNAADRCWTVFEPQLSLAGIVVEFLC